jgi:acyl-CoA thioesterase-1
LPAYILDPFRCVVKNTRISIANLLATRLKKICLPIYIIMNKILQYTYSVFLVLFVLSCQQSEEPGNKKELDKKETTSPGPVVKTIVFFGNSLTAGYGLEPSQAFPALLQQKIDSQKLAYKVINAGVSGETSSGGNSRVDWILEQPVDIFVLELGANDGLRGLPLSETRSNLQSIIDKVKSRYPRAEIVIAGMQMPPNLGQQYTAEFRSIFPDLAKKNNCRLIPFILEGVGGEAKFNQEDGIHPTAEGHKIVAENVWRELQPLLE